MILASRPLNPAKFPLRELNRGVLRTPRPPEPYPDRHYHPRHLHKPGRCRCPGGGGGDARGGAAPRHRPWGIDRATAYGTGLPPTSPDRLDGRSPAQAQRRCAGPALGGGPSFLRRGPPPPCRRAPLRDPFRRSCAGRLLRRSTPRRRVLRGGAAGTRGHMPRVTGA